MYVFFNALGLFLFFVACALCIVALAGLTSANVPPEVYLSAKQMLYTSGKCVLVSLMSFAIGMKC